MLGINGLELVVLVILGVFIVGPERLPEYAAQLGQLVKSLRRMANGAREQLRDEIGPDLDDVDWRKLDPRQYDPRRIIREALTDELGDTLTGPPPARATPATPTPTSTSTPSSTSTEPATSPSTEPDPDSQTTTQPAPPPAPVPAPLTPSSESGKLPVSASPQVESDDVPLETPGPSLIPEHLAGAHRIVTTPPPAPTAPAPAAPAAPARSSGSVPAGDVPSLARAAE